ncbi:MAG: sigma 54-interacting transcriptional regulator [Candidatus Omnitrophica bacterium]|nr:sigma 54-interacting transcriptional regulator [Candidatus Omnitrophota bacterium]
MSQDDPSFSFDRLVGKSQIFRDLIEKIKVVAQYDVAALITGETGTGKELAARAIHYNSPRKDQEFVVINCSAFSESLLESELFGYVKGSFTGAMAEKKGLFEAADKGTFFLDEIGDMSPALQAKILRVLQEGTYFKIGATSPVKVNVRVIAATNRDLRELIREGKFREDLYYRINVVSLHCPPLRERKEDVEVLTRHILANIAKKNQEPKKEISPGAMAILKKHDWPGNVRELENELEKAVIFSSEKKIVTEDSLSPDFLQRVQNRQTELLEEAAGAVSLKEIKRQAVEQIERKVIQRGLEKTNWNKTACAKLLRISRVDLIRKIARYQIRKGPF